MVDLSVIIVSWNVADLLVDCLNSLYNSGISLNFEVIVVDSASTDDTVSRVFTQFPQVKCLAQVENVGYTKGNNIGLSHATGDYLFLLNPDTVVLPQAVNRLIDYLVQHPTVGIVGPHTLNTDGTTQSTRRLFPTKTLAFFESTWLQPYAPSALLASFTLENQPDSGIFPVDWVQGSALLARRQVYEQIGGLDEGYTMYSEELDWCKRAKQIGWQVVYVGTAQIIHHGGKSSEQIGARKHIHFQMSKLRYFRKYHGLWFAWVLRLFLLVSYTFQWGIEALKYLIGHKRTLRKSRMSAYQQVLQSRLPIR